MTNSSNYTTLSDENLSVMTNSSNYTTLSDEKLSVMTNSSNYTTLSDENLSVMTNSSNYTTLSDEYSNLWRGIPFFLILSAIQIIIAGLQHHDASQHSTGSLQIAG
jgi:hypothetical protein